MRRGQGRQKAGFLKGYSFDLRGRKGLEGLGSRADLAFSGSLLTLSRMSKDC